MVARPGRRRPGRAPCPGSAVGGCLFIGRAALVLIGVHDVEDALGEVMPVGRLFSILPVSAEVWSFQFEQGSGARGRCASICGSHAGWGAAPPDVRPALGPPLLPRGRAGAHVRRGGGRGGRCRLAGRPASLIPGRFSPLPRERARLTGRPQKQDVRSGLLQYVPPNSPVGHDFGASSAVPIQIPGSTRR